MTLVDLVYTSALSPGTLIVDAFNPDGSSKQVKTIARVEETVEGRYTITFVDGTSTRADGDLRWMRA